MASDQFRPSDIRFWGIAALVCWALAILTANLALLVPDSMLAGLHASRLHGANMQQLRTEVDRLTVATTNLRRDGAALENRFALAEEADGAVTQRVGAIEVSLPLLLEALPAGTEIDRSAVTAALAAGGALSLGADGGTISISQSPLAAGSAVVPAGGQPMPALLPPEAQLPAPAFGIAIGTELEAAEAPAAWRKVSVRFGALLHGLEARLADQARSSRKRLIAGPLADISEATALCKKLQANAIACQPVPFTGTTLTP